MSIKSKIKSFFNKCIYEFKKFTTSIKKILGFKTDNSISIDEFKKAGRSNSSYEYDFFSVPDEDFSKIPDNEINEYDQSLDLSQNTKKSYLEKIFFKKNEKNKYI